MQKENKKYWKIAVPVPINSLFTYWSESEYNLIGYRVLVPFGNKNTLLSGVVIDSDNTIDFASVQYKEISEILDVQATFSSMMIQFILWLSEYYLCPIGECYRVAIPSGISPKTLVRYIVNRELSIKYLETINCSNTSRWQLLNFLISDVKGYSLAYLERYLGIKNLRYEIDYLLSHNLIFIERSEMKRIGHKTAKAVKLEERLLKDKDYLKEVLYKLDNKAPKQSALLGYLLSIIKSEEVTSKDKNILLSNINKVISNSNSLIKSLAEKKLLEVVDVEIDRNKNKNIGKLAYKNEEVLSLTAEQFYCVEEINRSIEQGKFSSYLLNGVTGSGKTIVYIHAIRQTLELGKSALLLVPEISLTPQLIDRFNIVFPDLIAVFHSRLSDGERYDAWRSVLENKAKIVIGARSAVFAPLNNLGLIIVDEEHDSSYKQDTSIPYYNCRDAALMRAKFEAATIVLGSATPSIESYYNAEIGKYKLLEIKHRADNATLPDIKIIDMLQARKTGQVIGEFSRTLIDSIKEKLSKKEGVILFQNKRGFANYLECQDCGNIPHCKHCSVTLTYHQITKELRCHYCGYTQKPFKICEVCGGKNIKLVGSGTQRVEEQLTDILQAEDIQCNIARLDVDSVRKKGSHRHILQNFIEGKTDILLGTQMVSKGLDFDRVTLVGVINADIQLNLPDFRSAEKTYQLLTQVSGRAGRSGTHKGEVIIQTSNPNHYAINSVMLNDYKQFYKIEIDKRQESMYPPFIHFCILEFSGKDEKKVEQEANQFHNLLINIINKIKNEKQKSIIIYPPQFAMIAKINDRYRIQITIKNIKIIDKQSKLLHAILQQAILYWNKEHANKSVQIKLDIDAYNSL